MSEDMQRKTYDEYVDDRRKLARLQAPAVRVTVGSDRDVEYRKEATLTYTLEMVGHLLERIEALEQRLGADGGNGVSTEGGFAGHSDADGHLGDD